MTTRRPSLALPGRNYDEFYFNQLVRALDAYFATLDNNSNFFNIPISGTGWGLPTGAIWNDNGTVKVVSGEPNQAYVAGVTITGIVGTVTVTTS